VPPAHAVSQQVPSTQKLVAQTPQPATQQSAPALASQTAPCGFLGLQSPSLPQNRLLTHSASLWHWVGQSTFVPSHANGAQAGLPIEPTGTTVQTPSAEAPSAAAHTSHAPLHG
jgi:hypothetical protein